MAAADFIVVLIAVIVEQINNIYSYSRFLLITPVCAVQLAVRVAIMDCSVWFTVAFTFDRYVAICTEKITTIVMLTIVVLSCARCSPFNFVVEPYVIIDNVPWRCVPVPEYYTPSMWKAYELFDSIMTP